MQSQTAVEEQHVVDAVDVGELRPVSQGHLQLGEFTRDCVLREPGIACLGQAPDVGEIVVPPAPERVRELLREGDRGIKSRLVQFEVETAVPFVREIHQTDRFICRPGPHGPGGFFEHPRLEVDVGYH